MIERFKPASLLLGGLVLALAPDAQAQGKGRGAAQVETLDLSRYSDAPPPEALDLVFLHHSVGQHLLHDPAANRQNGGGLRKLLGANRYRVHEATYGSELGEHTDLFDWLPKFRDRMDDVLRIDEQDKKLPGGRQNRVVLWKSCYPNNEFVDRGKPPGQPRGPQLTVENARATMRALLPEFRKRPDVLFVYLTAPALAPQPSTPRRKQSAALAREFNDWMKAKDGWLAGYPEKNVVVFDFYDVLTGGGASNFSRYATGGGSDSHPSSEGNVKAARLLVPFINRAVRRAGIVTDAPTAAISTQSAQNESAATH